jgi:threonine/homoserine/homoserine lactone efflux protein
MFELILLAFITGFIVAIPPGAVTVVSGQKALRLGFRNAMMFTIGSCMADIFYLFVVCFGVSYFFADNQVLRITMLFLSGALLLYLGISSVKNPRGMNSKANENGNRESDTKTILSGIGVTLLNPVTIVGWIAVGGNFFLLWNRQMPQAKNMSILLIPVIMLGVMTWCGPLLFFISRVRHYIEEKILRILIIGSGIFLTGLGGLSFFYGIKEIMVRL